MTARADTRPNFLPESGTSRQRRGGSRWLARRLALVVVAVVAVCAAWAAPAGAAPPLVKFAYSAGEIVPLPASIPHEEGDMVDRRIVPDLRWIAQRFPILVTDGYSGPLPNGEHVGCNNCHVRNSDHYNGVAVDVVPLNGSGKCDASWAGITRLAHWAEPVQGKPRPPFRWVGYDGDAGHGCGNHLHLSWEHAAAPMFQLAEWVEVFSAGNAEVAPQPRPKSAKGPVGGFATAPTGGLATGD